MIRLPAPVIRNLESLFLFSVLFASCSSSDRDAAIFRREADEFLAAMPAGLQDAQADAVLRACEGDTEPLRAVRASRNTESPLPKGVEAEYITPTLRLYVPTAAARRPLPLLVYLHGGGWTFGSIRSCARFCGALAATGEAMVLAVDYRLAPEHPYPLGLDDCMEALATARRLAGERGGDSALVSVGGDSSGGNLAIAAVLRNAAEGGAPIKSLVLFYPVVTARADNSSSWEAYGSGFALDGRLMEAFDRAYAPGREDDPMVSVSLASDEALAALPRTLLVAAERDILCSQGEEFADRLVSLGVDAHRELLRGSVHLFVTKEGQEHAFRRAVSLAADLLAE